jgi:signal transduction histidine kinase
MDVESRPGEGSRFIITLPRARQATGAARQKVTRT